MASYQRVTLNDIKSRLLERTGDTFWTEQEFKDAINEAIRIWQVMTGDWTEFLSTVVSSGNTYNVPRQICSLTRISINDVGLPMTALPEQDYGNPGWQGTTGTARYWAPSGVNLADIIPAPTSGTISWQGLQEAPVLTTDSDFINIGDQELVAMLGYCLHYLSFKEGTTEAKATLPMLQEMLKAAGEANAELRATNMYKKFMGIYREKDERPQFVGNANPGARS
jgi:hypothetical protein